MQDKKIIIHLHTYYQFTSSIEIFNCDEFHNINCVIQNDISYQPAFNEHIELFTQDKGSIDQIIKICKYANLVVVYGMDEILAYIVNRLPKNIKIAWRFFGYELYKRIPKVVYSDLTSALLKEKNFSENEISIRRIKKRLLLSLKKHFFCDQVLKAIKKTDIFLGIFYEEYEFLKSQWTFLPQYIRLPRGNKLIESITELKKKNSIVIGNSRSPYNNHLDILELIEKTLNKEKVEFIFLFNYGQLNNYSNVVQNKISKLNNFSIINEIIPKQDFNSFYNDKSAFVLNSYRQFAMGNIFLSIFNGTKVYLNVKNITYNWMTRNNFYVYPTSVLMDDIESNNITLTLEQANNNIHMYKKIVDDYSLSDFHKRIMAVIMEL